MVETALPDAERTGFRLAVIGRTRGLVAIAVFYLAVVYFSRNIKIAGLIMASTTVGLASLALAGSPSS